MDNILGSLQVQAASSEFSGGYHHTSLKNNNLTTLAYQIP